MVLVVKFQRLAIFLKVSSFKAKSMAKVNLSRRAVLLTRAAGNRAYHMAQGSSSTLMDLASRAPIIEELSMAQAR